MEPRSVNVQFPLFCSLQPGRERPPRRWFGGRARLQVELRREGLRAAAGVAQASSPPSSGGVSPPVPTRGETPRELAGGTPAVPWRNRPLAGGFPGPFA